MQVDNSSLTAAALDVYNVFMSTTANFEKCRARRHAGGFTLAELLTVISIMAILMAMLTPSVYSVFFTTRKAGCQSNLRSIVQAANRYAQADSKMRLPTIRPAAATTWGTTTWGNMKTGNPGCLARLIDAKLADRELFLCQEAQSTRKFTTMAMDANKFTYTPVSVAPPPPQGVSTLSYSYTSMVYNTAWKTTAAPLGNVADQMTMDQVPATLVVLADQNPRCTFGTTGFAVGIYDNLYDLFGKKLSTYAPKLKKNSLNHKNKGQNIARWDSSVKWITDANNPNTPEDDIYRSSSPDETLGRRKEMNDSFLIP
jgi:prepilin-type N-terminal cleavage/methylation domain-containing protein